MKKGRLKKRLALGFWLVFALGCLWLALVPPQGGHAPLPSGVTVKVAPHAVEPSPEVPEPQPESAAPPGGEEQRPSPPPTLPPSAILTPVEPPAHERPVMPPGARKPRIALLIDDVGPNLRESDRAIALPAPVTLAFLPYAVRVREQARAAHEAGHELMLHMPMEPVGREDPGPGALLTELPLRDIQQRLETALSSFAGFDGINNHMGSKFTSWPEGMDVVMDELAARGLFFLDSRTIAQSVGASTARSKGVPTVARDVFLDDDQAPAAIRRQLALTEHIARARGQAVAIGHPHVTTLAVLEQWIDDAQARGIEFVPVRALVEK